jgi:hypothetical protein
MVFRSQQVDLNRNQPGHTDRVKASEDANRKWNAISQGKDPNAVLDVMRKTYAAENPAKPSPMTGRDLVRQAGLPDTFLQYLQPSGEIQVPKAALLANPGLKLGANVKVIP